MIIAVRLSDGRELDWDQILTATVASERQAEFDRNIVEIGLPLYRIRRRLSVQDWAGLTDLAERQYERLAFDGLQAKQNPRSTYLICVATMKSRLYRGNRASAVLPFLQAALIQQAWQTNEEDHLTFLPPADVRSLQSSEILPIWFEHQQVELAFPRFASSFVPTSETQVAGPIIYMASMAIEMKRLELARQLLPLLSDSTDQVKAWRLILLAQIQIAQGDSAAASKLLESNQANLVGGSVAVAHYLSAAEFFERQHQPDNASDQLTKARQTAIDQRADAMLRLLRIPALFGERYPALSAAALYQSSQIAKSMAWDAESQTLEQELSIRYPRSFHAQLVRKTQREIEK